MRISTIVAKLYGKPCWGVKPGWGSFLTLEFGKPHLEIREPMAAKRRASRTAREAFARRSVNVHGEWHLWIYCCDWEVFSRGKRLGDSSTKRRVRRAAELLNGQMLKRFWISLPDVICVFEFDLGASLKTRPYDSESEQWLLYEPSHKVLGVRADGPYRYVASDRTENEAEWKPIRGAWS